MEKRAYQPPKNVRKTQDGMYKMNITPVSLEKVVETAMIRELHNVKYEE